MNHTIKKLSFATAITGIVIGLYNFCSMVITKIILINIVREILLNLGITKTALLDWVDTLANSGVDAVTSLLGSVDITWMSQRAQDFLTSDKVTQMIASAVQNGFDTLANKITTKLLNIPFLNTLFGITEGNPAGFFYLQLILGVLIFALITLFLILAYKKTNWVYLIICLVLGLLAWNYSFGLIFIGSTFMLIGLIYAKNENRIKRFFEKRHAEKNKFEENFKKDQDDEKVVAKVVEAEIVEEKNETKKAKTVTPKKKAAPKTKTTKKPTKKKDDEIIIETEEGSEDK